MSFLINPFVFAQSGASLTAETGTFALTGNTAALKRALRMSAATGAFTLTGNDAGFDVGIRMQAETGAFTLTGNDVELKRALKMAANTGAFTLTGNEAALLYLPDLPDLAIWLDANDGSTVTLRDSQYVTTWADNSGNGINASQATAANQPEYVTSGTRPLVRFNGTSHYLTAALGTLTQPTTIFYAGSFGNKTGGVMLDGTGSTNRQVIGAGTATTADVVMWSGSVGPSWGNMPQSFGVYTAVFNGASSSARKDGVQVNTGNPGSNSIQGLTLGARFSAARFLDGDVGELLIYDRLLNATEIGQVETYLMNKW